MRGNEGSNVGLKKKTVEVFHQDHAHTIEKKPFAEKLNEKRSQCLERRVASSADDVDLNFDSGISHR